MPVDLRRHEELCWRLRLANTSCLSRLRLPCGTEGAVPRLWAARRLLDELKTSADTAVSRLVTRAAYTLLPAGCARRLSQRCLLLPAALLLANLAGPEAAIQVWNAGPHPYRHFRVPYMIQVSRAIIQLLIVNTHVRMPPVTIRFSRNSLTLPGSDTIILIKFAASSSLMPRVALTECGLTEQFRLDYAEPLLQTVW